MTTSRKRVPIDGQPTAAEEPAAAAPAAANGGETIATTTPGEVPRLAGLTQSDAEEDADALRRERDMIADRELRLRAEFENFRRRASRDALEARERAQGQLLGELLPVLDNLERALDAAEHHDEGKVLGGVRMTRDMFVELLRRAGVEEIDTVGAAFDPHVHEAVVLQPSPREEGIITAALERGYRQGDRVLRPARVVVSSGPAQPVHGRE